MNPLRRIGQTLVELVRLGSCSVLQKRRQQQLEQPRPARCRLLEGAAIKGRGRELEGRGANAF